MKEKRRNIPFPQTYNSLYKSGFKYLWEKGILDEYDNNHFIIQALMNNPQIFDRVKKYCNVVTMYAEDKKEFPQNFCVNFEGRLQTMYNIFGQATIEDFIKGQLAAGKKHYSESQFFEALTEIEVLLFFACFGPGLSKGIYEPKTGKGNHNPEATFEYKTGDKISIEVKTPEFQWVLPNNDEIMPLYLLTDNGINQFDKVCKQSGYIFKKPRVSKLKSFLDSACDKFNIPTEKEYNILCINWTYTDITYGGYIEPAMLLYNPINGIFNHRNIAKQLKIDEDIYEKISAIFVFQNSVDSILFTDLRYLWADYPRRAIMMLNPFLLNTEAKREEFYGKIQIRPNDFRINFDMKMYYDTACGISPIAAGRLNKIINEMHLKDFY